MQGFLQLCLAQRVQKHISCNPPANMEQHAQTELYCALIYVSAMQVVPVTIDQFSLQGYYACPVYTNMQRANVYSPIVSSFTMKTDEPSHKWVLASVAVLLQDELA